MKKIRVLVVEDSALAAEGISVTLRKYSLDPVQVCESGEEAVSYFQHNEVDLVLMDIVLRGTMDGISAAQLIRTIRAVPIIYLTDHVDEPNVNRAKQTYPANYLSKPYNEAELVRAIELAFNNALEARRQSRPKPPAEEDVFVRTDNQQFVRIDYKEVLYLEAARSYCNVVTDKATYTLCSSMNQVQEKFDHPDLIRVHRSYVINSKRITKIDGNIVYMGDRRVDMGKEFRENLMGILKVIK